MESLDEDKRLRFPSIPGILGIVSPTRSNTTTLFEFGVIKFCLKQE